MSEMTYNVSTKKYMETKSNGQYAKLRYGLLYIFRCMYLSKLEVNKYQRQIPDTLEDL
jgi:hypothetical protein